MTNFMHLADRGPQFIVRTQECPHCKITFHTSGGSKFCDIPCAFWGKVAIGKPDECWIWLGAKHNKLGHGSFRFNGRARVASRYALGLHIGRDLVKGEYACHKCDNPSCVNPEHLYVGNATSNTRDQMARNRHPLAARTHCKNGHELTIENTGAYTQGGFLQRRCLTCARDRYAERKALEGRIVVPRGGRGPSSRKKVSLVRSFVTALEGVPDT